MARPPHLGGAEALNFIAVWLTIAATTVPDRGLPPAWYSFFSMLRVVAVLWLAAVVWLRARERWTGLTPTTRRCTRSTTSPARWPAPTTASSSASADPITASVVLVGSPPGNGSDLETALTEVLPAFRPVVSADADSVLVELWRAPARDVP